jgi:hypothetical protein
MIDVTFDHRTDSNGKDPDLHSPTLRKHHQELWSKELPSGVTLTLEKIPNHYLLHTSRHGEFSLSSDTISNSVRSHKKLKHITNQIPSAELDSFQALGSTIGAKILFPGKKIDKKLTINVARGLNSRIKDRFDLTLECIRLQYQGLDNPLSKTLMTFWAFFELFENFEKYVEFFHLEDLLQNGEIRFFLPFEDGFDRPPLPTSVEEYMVYRKNTMNFVAARNLRIQAWATEGNSMNLKS